MYAALRRLKDYKFISRIYSMRNISNVNVQPPPPAATSFDDSIFVKCFLKPFAFGTTVSFITSPGLMLYYNNYLNNNAAIEEDKKTYKTHQIAHIDEEIKDILQKRGEFQDFANAFFTKQIEDNNLNLHVKISIYRYIEKYHLKNIETENLLIGQDVFNKYISTFKPLSIYYSNKTDIETNTDIENAYYNVDKADYNNYLNEIIEFNKNINSVKNSYSSLRYYINQKNKLECE